LSGFGAIKTGPFVKLDGGVDEYHEPAEIGSNKLQGQGKTTDIHIDGGVLKVRPRKDLWGPSFDNAFRGAIEYIDPDGNARLLVASNKTIYEVDASSKTGRDTNPTTDEDLHFHVHRGRCWYNGENTQRKITRTTTARVGVVAPETAPTAASGEGTGLTGSYAWKYTFVIEEDGVKKWESDPSSASESVSLSNEDATITPAASGDSRVNARYIYRTSASGTSYQYDGKISNNTEGATFTSSQADALLGDLVEATHGVPAVGEISEGCNERMFWIVNEDDGARLYWSEQAHTEAYQEYQVSTNYKELLLGGKGRGLKRLMNPNTGREDLYVFQERGVSVLPGGEPNAPLYVISNKVGCYQHDTIQEYRDSIIFFSTDNVVYQIAGGRLIDISSRSWPKSIAALNTKTSTRGAIIFNDYYALTCRSSGGKLYNHTAWICDLRKIREIQNGMADACWYPWEIDAAYLLQRVDGTVLAFSNKDRRIYILTFDEQYDDDADAAGHIVVAKFHTKEFGGQQMTQRKTPRQIFVKGKQEHQLSVTPHFGSFYADSGSAATLERAEGGSVFIMGQSVMGSPLTEFPVMMSEFLDNSIAGTYFSFAFEKNHPDRYFECHGIQFTYNAFQTGELK